MKLQSTFDRGADKEATDLLDIVRLTLDRECGPTARSQLAGATDQLKKDVAQHVDFCFESRRPRTLKLIQQVPEGRDTELDDLALVHELLTRTVLN